MGTCAGIKVCDACNLSEYEQNLEFKIVSFTADKRRNPSLDSIDLLVKKNDESTSWWNFEKLLDSDKSWEVKVFDNDKTKPLHGIFKDSKISQ